MHTYTHSFSNYRLLESTKTRVARVVDIPLTRALALFLCHSFARVPAQRIDTDCVLAFCPIHILCVFSIVCCFSLLHYYCFFFFSFDVLSSQARARLARVKFIEQCNVIIVDFVVGIDSRACYRDDSHFMDIHAQLNIKFIHTRFAICENKI